MPKKSGFTTLRETANGDELIFSREKYVARIEFMIIDPSYPELQKKNDIYEQIYESVRTKYPNKRFSYDAVANYAKKNGNGPSKDVFEVIVDVLECEAEDLLVLRAAENMNVGETLYVETSNNSYLEDTEFSRETLLSLVARIPSWKSFMITYLRYSNFTFRAKDIEGVIRGTVVGDENVNSLLENVLVDLWEAIVFDEKIDWSLGNVKLSLSQYSRKRELLNQIKFYGIDIWFIYKWLIYVNKVTLSKIDYLKIISPIHEVDEFLLDVIETFVANVSHNRIEYILPLSYSPVEFKDTSLVDARRYISKALAMDLTFPNHIITKMLRVSRISGEPFEIDKYMISYLELCDLYKIKSGLDLVMNYPKRYQAVIFYADDFIGNDYLKGHIEKYAAENNIVILYCNKVIQGR